ncbi:DUF349 domain-containing protein [Porphyromonas circumdentaria]|uniref:DUF349 domain-containing protein n=1 Tax=Porphyromonas circumdentaria TaxID=29524 RepID=A0A1T4NNV9_9PORP|nr:DUF349 domain-containing protein [Porphyromonas circumdentaria]MBB6276129.1 hypothetical protein [Porphyromonas circumdentaria]MDO4723086.1 DUF349 domain-containing protein [Porphyromonas circumdentaria]SJZ80458.1 protein of unknown function [Porphyromonas circumdentaria]
MEQTNKTSNEEILPTKNELTEGAQEQTPAFKSYTPEEIEAMTCPEIVDAIVLMSQQDVLPPRREIDTLKRAFDKKKAEYAESSDESHAALLEQAEIQESRLKDLLQTYKERYKQQLEDAQKEQENNFEKKMSLIATLREIVESNADFQTIRTRYHELMESWRSIGLVPESKYANMQQEFNLWTEKFYDLKQINDEFRSYDFKKNLQAKRDLIERAKELCDSTDVVEASKELQELHRLWKETGPVEKELREQIWQEFNEYSRTIHKKRQEFFDNRLAQEEANLEAKKALCERVESLNIEKLKTMRAWQEATEKVLATQAEWKTIGIAPKSDNASIYARFRAACDFFFETKASFFKQTREEYSENIEAKKKIVGEAEALASSTDWNKTADRLKALQAEWKKIGPTPKKIGDELWLKLRTACDTFFEAKKAQTSGRSEEQNKNLELKRDIIAKIEAFAEGEEEANAQEQRERLNALINEFNEVGHVPFKEKEKIYKAFHKAVDKVYERLQISRNQQQIEHFSETLDALVQSGDVRKLKDQLEHLYRVKEKIEKEMQTTTSSMDLFFSTSKWGDSMIKEIEHKKQRLDRDLVVIKEKIALLRDKIKEAQS